MQCNAIHKTIVEQFKQAIVYGRSVKHQPQRVGLTHELADEDISEESTQAERTPRPSLTASSNHHQTMIWSQIFSTAEHQMLGGSFGLQIRSKGFTTAIDRGSCGTRIDALGLD